MQDLQNGFNLSTLETQLLVGLSIVLGRHGPSYQNKIVAKTWRAKENFTKAVPLCFQRASNSSYVYK